MQHATRALVLALIVGLLAVAPVAASSQPSSSSPTAAAPSAPLSTRKVVIIVGATHGSTSGYRSTADSIYAEAIKHSSNVIKIYSPNATWAAVKPAITGASVVVYLGHGNGWPSPYTYDPNFTTKDGLGLNATAGNGDNNVKYYGEPSLATVDLAPNAVVLLNHLCYASGNSEPGHAAPTLSVAKQRVDNYGAGFIKAGAKAVIAEGHGSINGMIRDLFTTHQSVVDVWRTQSNYHGNEFSFTSSRSGSGYRAYMDPDSSSGGYYRSIVASPNLRTEDVTGVPFSPTDIAPDTLQNPGAATTSQDVTLYDDEGLNWADGSLNGGTAVRIEDLSGGGWASGGSADAAYVEPLSGGEGGWVDADHLAPQDSSSPELWTIAGARTISPNGDGHGDVMDLTMTFSEDVTYSIVVRDGSTPVWSGSGSGKTTHLVWDAKVGGNPLHDGTYQINVNAQDEWGNEPLATDVPLTVDTSPRRLAGSDRYATSAAISASTFPANVPVAYLATGLNFPDALAGAAAAGSQGAPILLVLKDSIPNPTAVELVRLKPGRIVILGSTGVVSNAVASAADGYTTGSVTRLAGPDRYATAAAISAATFAPGVSFAFVATGLNFPDALAGAAAAGSRDAPILLVTKDSIPGATAAELARLNPNKIVVLGASGVISGAVMDALANYATEGAMRLAGVDRYATAAAISTQFFWGGADVTYLATGANFPDALAGAAAAGSKGAPILLVRKDSIPPAAAAEVTRLDPKWIIVLGSSGVVSETVRIQLGQLID